MGDIDMDQSTITGVEEIDQEHALELQIVRSIRTTLATDDREKLGELLARLEDFTNAHFLGEQLLMRLHAYPGYQAHQEEHDNLMTELRELSQRLLTQESIDPDQEAENLERWLITHIQSEDQALAEYLKQSDIKS
jgi:hemerythrin-like metal-binding protein